MRLTVSVTPPFTRASVITVQPIKLSPIESLITTAFPRILGKRVVRKDEYFISIF